MDRKDVVRTSISPTDTKEDEEQMAQVKVGNKRDRRNDPWSQWNLLTS